MPLDIESIVDECVKDERTGQDRHDLRWSVMVPAVLARVKEVLAGKVVPQELINPKPEPRTNPTDPAWRHLDMLKNLQDDLDLAMIPRDTCPADKVGRRAEVLEFLRSWFTRAFKHAHGPCHLRFVAGETERPFRL